MIINNNDPIKNDDDDDDDDDDDTEKNRISASPPSKIQLANIKLQSIFNNVSNGSKSNDRRLS